jgi:hypothetical protein
MQEICCTHSFIHSLSGRRAAEGSSSAISNLSPPPLPPSPFKPLRFCPCPAPAPAHPHTRTPSPRTPHHKQTLKPPFPPTPLLGIRKQNNARRQRQLEPPLRTPRRHTNVLQGDRPRHLQLQSGCQGGRAQPQEAPPSDQAAGQQHLRRLPQQAYAQPPPQAALHVHPHLPRSASASAATQCLIWSSMRNPLPPQSRKTPGPRSTSASSSASSAQESTATSASTSQR